MNKRTYCSISGIPPPLEANCLATKFYFLKCSLSATNKLTHSFKNPQLPCDLSREFSWLTFCCQMVIRFTGVRKAAIILHQLFNIKDNMVDLGLLSLRPLEITHMRTSHFYPLVVFLFQKYLKSPHSMSPLGLHWFCTSLNLVDSQKVTAVEM